MEPSASFAETQGVFQVTLGDFSGPLDLLCGLVESRAMDVSKVKLTDVLTQYVSYMLVSKKATLDELAEFFSLASRLLLRKVRALLPRADGEDEAQDGFGEGEDADLLSEVEMDEETLAALLERFKPYRTAAGRLAALKEARERSFVRISDEGGPPWYDLGDLYSLATLWWGLIEERTRRRDSSSEEGFLREIPDAVPEEVLVEQRMDEVRVFLRGSERRTLRGLLEHFPPNSLIVTLLALLELSRLGMLNLVQAEAWGDVEIAAA